MSNPTDPWAQNESAPVPPADPYAAPADPYVAQEAAAEPAYGAPTTPPAYGEAPAAPAYGVPTTPPAYGAAPSYDSAAAPAYGAPAAPAYGAPAAPGYAAPYGSTGYPVAGSSYGAAPVKTNVMALVSLIASCAAFILGITSIVGIVCGHIALNQIKRTGENGRGMALAGLIIGYVLTIGFVLLMVLLIGLFAAQSSYYG